MSIKKNSPVQHTTFILYWLTFLNLTDLFLKLSAMISDQDGLHLETNCVQRNKIP